MLSGPADKVCLEVRRAASTLGIEKLTSRETGALQTGGELQVEPFLVKTDAKYVLRASALSASDSNREPSFACKGATLCEEFSLPPT